MTGFGKAEKETSIGRLSVEIQSLNRKFLESSIYLPKEFAQLETEVKKQVASRISRGSVSVRVNIQTEEAVEHLLPDLSASKKLKALLEKRAKDLGFSKSDITLAFLMQNFRDLPRREICYDLKKVQKVLKETMSIALEELTKMRVMEGQALSRDLVKRLKTLEKFAKDIEKRAPKAVASYRKKLEEKAKEYLKDPDLADERMMKEILLFSEKVDISEELTRFFSHIEQFRSLVIKKNSVGRSMDFIIQEMVREVNTMGSKCNEISVIQIILEMKGEIEKIREQVQNIE